MIGAWGNFDENPKADGPLGPKRPEDARQRLCLVFSNFRVSCLKNLMVTKEVCQPAPCARRVY